MPKSLLLHAFRMSEKQSRSKGKQSKAKRVKSFCDYWLEDDVYKDWLKKIDDDETKFGCKVCKKTLSLSSAGKSAVTEHGDGPTHQKILNNRLNFFNPKGKKCSEADSGNQKTLDSVPNHAKIKAEIIWLMKSVDSGYSTRSSDDIVDTIRAMCPDSRIAESVKMKRTKASYIINHGLAPYFQDKLLEELNKTDILVLSFDESLNDVTQTGEMVVMVRFWSSTDSEVKTRYLDSSFFGHARATDLLKHFNEIVSKINKSNVYQISMDGPTVNHKFIKILIKDWERELIHQLVNVGSCNLHIVSGGFKTGGEATGWNISQTLKGSYQIFHDSPARRDDFETVTESNVYPKFFCATRWVENKVVAERLLEVWPNIHKIVKWWQQQKGRQPTDNNSKSMINVKAALEDPLTEAKLHFFSFVAQKLEPFLTKYQVEKPMFVFMYRDLKVVINDLLQMIIKPDVLEKAKTGKQLKEIDLSNEDNLLATKDVDIGFAAETKIKKLLGKDGVSKKQVKTFKEQCSLFVSSILSKMFVRSPIDSEILKASGVFNPVYISQLPKKSLQKTLKRLLFELVELKIISISHGDKALQQFSSFYDVECQLHQGKFERFSDKDERLDTFYFSEIGVQKYKELSFIIRLVLTFSHGQSAVERDFSLKKNLEEHNQTPETIVAKRRIKDHLTSNKLKPYEIVVDKELMLAVKNARLKYIAHLEEQAKENAKNDAEKEKMRVAQERIDALDQVERDFEVINAGIASAEMSVEDGSLEVTAISKMKKINRKLLQESNSKIEMGMKRKSELQLELETLTKKKKSLEDEK